MAGDEPLEPDAAVPAEPTFADVLNNLSLGRGRNRDGRRGRHSGAPESAQTGAGDSEPDTPGWGDPEPGDPVSQPSRTDWPPANADDGHRNTAEWKAVAWEHGDEAEIAPAAVRPYARTGGRTHPVRDLGVETLVSTSDLGRDSWSVRSVEHIAIARLCERTHSVAEVSALLQLPLGVARVLLADMADAGLVEILRNPGDDSGAADLPLMERVIAGLRNL